MSSEKSSNFAPVVVFATTAERFKEEYRKGNRTAYIAQILYQEFMKCTIYQNTKDIYCTQEFICNKEKGLGLSVRQYKQGKDTLRKMGLISNTWFNKRTRQHYFKVVADNKTDDYQLFLNNKQHEKTSKIRSINFDKIRSLKTYPLNTTTISLNTTTIRKEKYSKEYTHPSDAVNKQYVTLKSGRRLCRTIPVQKESTLSQEKDKPCSRITKNSAVDNMKWAPEKKVYERKHPETVASLRLYQELVSLGATKHNQSKVSYLRTMDLIFELISPEYRNPYCNVPDIPDDYRHKEWNHEEIVEVFKFCFDKTKGKVKDIGWFIFAKKALEKDKSFLVNYHVEMKKMSTDTLEGSGKIIVKELGKIIPKEDMLNAKEFNAVVRMMDLYTHGYRVNESLNHLYYGKIEYVLTDYIKEEMRRSSFHLYYIKGEKFMKQFVQEFVQRGVFIN